MSDALVQVPADSLGKKIDAEQLTVSGQSVLRQRVVLSDLQTDVDRRG